MTNGPPSKEKAAVKAPIKKRPYLPNIDKGIDTPETENAPLFRGVQDECERETEAPFTDGLTGLYNHGFFVEVLGGS
jgi:hypothetical protein